MNKKLKVPLNLQLFAEGDNQGGNISEGNQEGTTTPQIDYEKMAEAINKRTSQTADSVLKGYLKQQGLTGDELTQAIESFKTQKSQAEVQKQQEFENYKAENIKLKAQILNADIDSKLTKLAAGEGILSEKIPFLLKLIDRNELTDDKGNVLDDKVKEAMNVVIKAFPDFKGTPQQNGGFQQIGGAGNQQQTNTTDDQLDAIFGIKK